MAMIFDWCEVFRRPVAIAGHQIQVVCTARMSGCGTLFPLPLLVVAQRREHVRPGFDAEVTDLGCSPQPLADRCAAVARAAKLPQQLEVQFSIGKSQHSRLAASELFAHSRSSHQIDQRRVPMITRRPA
jgi:hypothetical protein